MSIITQAITALSDVLRDRLALTSAPTIIASSPSEVADYPSVAIWPEDFQTEWSQNDELTVDADGELAVGARATISPPVGPATMDDGSHLSHVGTHRISGRIFVGSRLAPRREEIQSQITGLFLEDDMRPGVLDLEIAQPRVGSQILPWPWTVTVSLDDVEWTREYAMSERLWAWLSFDMDVAILVDRRNKLMIDIIIAMKSGFSENLEIQPAEALPLAEQYLVTLDGDVVQYP